jgi:hypothetical protein
MKWKALYYLERELRKKKEREQERDGEGKRRKVQGEKKNEEWNICETVIKHCVKEKHYPWLKERKDQYFYVIIGKNYQRNSLKYAKSSPGCSLPLLISYSSIEEEFSELFK